MSTTSTSTSPAPLPPISACCSSTTPVADAQATELARVFRALADPARVKILSMLLNADEVCACDLGAGIARSPATASHHLKLLRDAGLVTGEKRGTWIWYSVVPERLAAVRTALTDHRLPAGHARDTY